MQLQKRLLRKSVVTLINKTARVAKNKSDAVIFLLILIHSILKILIK